MLQAKKGKRNPKRKNLKKKYYQPSFDRRMVVHVPGVGVPDRLIQRYKYSEVPTIRFTALVDYHTLNYNLNSCDVIATGGSQAVINYFTNGGIGWNYQRYRVLRSYITVTLQSIETADPFFILLFPSLTLPSVANAADWTTAASYDRCKRTVVGPATSGHCSRVIKMVCDPQQLVGPEYLEQDEYSGTVTSAAAAGIQDPSTLIYWGISALDLQIAGFGLDVQVTIEMDVEHYEPRRNS